MGILKDHQEENRKSVLKSARDYTRRIRMLLSNKFLTHADNALTAYQELFPSYTINPYVNKDGATVYLYPHPLPNEPKPHMRDIITALNDLMLPYHLDPVLTDTKSVDVVLVFKSRGKTVRLSIDRGETTGCSYVIDSEKREYHTVTEGHWECDE